MSSRPGEQIIHLSAPPLAELPVWGRRMEFDAFLVELVPRSRRIFNVRLDDTFASISFGGATGTSSLAGDRLRRYERKPFEFIIAPPRFPLRGETKTAPEVLAFVVRHEKLRNTIAATVGVDAESLTPQVVIGNPAPFITELAKRIRVQLNQKSPPPDYVESLCLAILVEMFKTGFTNKGRPKGAKGEAVVPMLLGFIDANLEADLSLERLSALSGLSETQLNRAFKKEIGESPYNYIIQRRADVARSLLENRDYSLAHIAYATGFSSQSHMTTAFKKVFGVTPGVLRRAAPGISTIS